MILAAERPKHPRSGRPVCVHPEPGRGLGPDRSSSVVPRCDLDIHSAAPPLGVDVLDLRIAACWRRRAARRPSLSRADSLRRATALLSSPSSRTRRMAAPRQAVRVGGGERRT